MIFIFPFDFGNTICAPSITTSNGYNDTTSGWLLNDAPVAGQSVGTANGGVALPEPFAAANPTVASDAFISSFGLGTVDNTVAWNVVKVRTTNDSMPVAKFDPTTHQSIFPKVTALSKRALASNTVSIQWGLVQTNSKKK